MSRTFTFVIYQTQFKKKSSHLTSFISSIIYEKENACLLKGIIIQNTITFERHKKYSFKKFMKTWKITNVSLNEVSNDYV